MLKTLICKYFGHKIDRRHVWNDSIDFRTDCARCRVPLLRDHLGWREFESARDEDPVRTAHPRA